MEMSPIQIVNQPHPLIPSADRKFSAQNWREGETARETLLRAGLDPHTEIVIIVNDRTLTVEEWDTVCTKPGDMIHAVAALSGGGDGGSNPLKIVLTIVVMIVAWYAAPYLGSAMAATEAGAAMGLSTAAWTGISAGMISMAGNMVLGAVFKSSPNSLSSVNGSSSANSSTPTYSLSGGSNSIRQYAPMQVVMGQHRVFPDYGSKPYTELSGDDQYLYQIFNFGLSSLQLTDLKIGDSPVSNYADVSLKWSDDSGALPGFPGNVDTDVGASLVRGEDWIVRTSSANTTKLAVDVEGTCYYAADSGLVPCVVRVESQYRPVGGSWAPLIRGTDVTYTTGYWSLQTIETMHTDAGGDGGGTEQVVVQHAYAESGHSEGETKFLRSIIVLEDNGQYAQVDIYATWRWTLFTSAKSLNLANDGPKAIYTTVDHVSIQHGASQSAQRRTFALDVPSGTYDVRVRLTSAASTLGEIAVGDNRGGYTYSFSTLRSYQDDTASYVGQTRLGMLIRASGQLSGVISKLSAMASAYTWAKLGDDWRWVPTSNPAWWYLDFARGRKNSAGVKLYGCHLTDGQIDIAGIIAWAAFCDTEKMTCNLVLDSQQSASDTLSDIARCGLGSSSWASGKLGVVWDKRNASPVAAFGMSNIIKGSFSVKYATENLADEIVVSYVDKDQEWEQKQVRVTIPGVTSPQRSSTLELKGCTNAAMAWKYANVQAAAQVYRRRMITWDADMEGFVCQRGDVVLLQHDLTQWGYSGRLVAVDGAVITLDRQVPRSGAVEYVMLASPDGSMQTWQIEAGSGESDTLTLPEAPGLQDGALTLDHRWLFSPLPTPGKKVKLVSVKPVSTYRVQIVATDEVPEFYAAWSGVFNAPAKQTLLRNVVPTITRIAISERLVMAGPGEINTRVEVTFSVVGTFENIYIDYRIAGGPWKKETITSNTLRFDTNVIGSLEVTAAPLSGFSLGKRFSASREIYGTSLPPADVPYLNINGDTLTWGVVSDVDLVGYQLRWQTGNSRSWGDAQPMHQGLIIGNSHTMIVRPPGAVSLLIKAVDMGGRESVNVAYVATDLGNPLVANIVLTKDFHALGFPGSISGATIETETGDLIANIDAEPLLWSNDEANLWDVDDDSLIWQNYTYSAISFSGSLSVVVEDVGAQLTLPIEFTAGIFSVNYRKEVVADLWSGDADQLWTDDDDLLWKVDPWLPWPGAVVAEQTIYEWQISAAAGTRHEQPRISAIAAQIDVPDIFERFSDVVIPSGGARLPITKSYRQISNVSLTLQSDGGNAQTAIVIDKSTSFGPLTECLNNSGLSTSGLIDATIQGY